MSADLAQLSRLRLEIEGAEREIALHPPRVADVFRLILDPTARGPVLAESALVADLIQVVEVDGEPIEEPLARRLLRAPATLAKLLAAKNRLYLYALEQGRARPACPRCDAENDLDLLFYAVALHAPPWDLFEQGALLAPPRIVRPEAAGARPPGVPRTPRLGFELPAARLGLTDPEDAVRGVLGGIDPEMEREAWARWAPPGVEQPDGRNHWRPRHPGFRAVLRMSVALRRLERADGTAVDPTPEAVERLFVADFHFLDLLHHFTHALDAPAGATVACPRCGTRFLPLG